MDTTTSAPDVQTFRGRSLEEVLPQVREALGPDAIVLRRREGLAGGVGGFFQRPFVEVEARRPLEDERQGIARNDRATAEGLASPAIQALVDQASPFADALSRAQGDAGVSAQEVLLAAARGSLGAEPQPEPEPAPEPRFEPDPEPAPAPAGLYGPQPNIVAREEPAPEPDPEPVVERPRAAAREITKVEIPDEAPPVATAHEAALVANGLSPALASDVVGEAVAHGLPFSDSRSIKKLIRSVLARRIATLADLGPATRSLAFVGAGGAGKSQAIRHLATAYAAADAQVLVIALRTPDGGSDLAARLEPAGIAVFAAADAEQANRRIARGDATLVLIDTPPAGPGEREVVSALAADLTALDIGEVHLTLPATMSAAAADEQAEALAPLSPTHVAMTHTDQTARPGAVVELAITSRRPVSYLSTRDRVEPADAAELAQRLLP
jgi:flagellar biosynthesis GTPase FlhF